MIAHLEHEKLNCMRPLVALLSVLLACPLALACDTDADCGVGGTCIKREKRASGVCYGGSRDSVAPQAPQTGTPPSYSGEVSNEARQQLMEFMGDPDQLIRDQLPGREIGGKCTVNTDCPAGFDCVHAHFEGRCVKL
jgi:hypothetical protein